MAKRAPYLGPAKRREPVLDAALQVFSAGGFEAASMAKIAAQAEISKAVLYDVFPGGKTEMFDALLERGERQFLEHLRSAPPIDSTDRAVVFQHRLGHFLEFAEINPLVFRVVFGDAGTATSAIAKRHKRGRELIIDELFGATMESLGVSEEFAAVVDLYMHMIVAVAEEMARWMLRHPEVHRDAIVALSLPFLLHGLDGVAPRGDDGSRRKRR